MKFLAMLLAVIASHHHHKHRIHWNRSMASWYYDYGQTASGLHYRYGFASLIFSSEWGRSVRFCYRGRCVVGRLDDHGPYVLGRTFDLNQNLAEALGFSGVGIVKWRLI